MDASKASIWVWITRGRGGVLSDSVSIFKKPPMLVTSGKASDVRWDDPDDKVVNPNRLCLTPGEFYNWFGFVPDMGSCQLYALHLRAHET